MVTMMMMMAGRVELQFRFVQGLGQRDETSEVFHQGGMPIPAQQSPDVEPSVWPQSGPSPPARSSGRPREFFASVVFVQRAPCRVPVNRWLDKATPTNRYIADPMTCVVQNLLPAHQHTGDTFCT